VRSAGFPRSKKWKRSSLQEMSAFRLAVVLALAALLQERTYPALRQHTFTVAKPSELVANITVRCDTCAWDVEGREAVALMLNLDSRPAIILPITRTGRAEYRVMLGTSGPGSRTLHVDQRDSLTARELRGRDAAAVELVSIDQIDLAAPEGLPMSLAPFVHARADTVGRFTDVPLFMWYEVEPTARGKRFRYSVIFSNEDGGTPTDRLMATWGRTTDIEYIYSVEVSEQGAVLSEDMQGPKHEVLPFQGRRESRHPLLWVSTSNNMVLDRGASGVKYAPAPMPFPLDHVSREAVMDAHPWLYDVMTKELAREKKIVPDAPPGNDTIPHPRHFAFVEGCGEVGDHALAIEVLAGNRWFSSDRGLPQYRVVRDGCFRVAVPLPQNVTAAQIRGIRVQAYERARPSTAPGTDKTTTVPVRFRRVNTLFMLDERDEQLRPRSSLMTWQGLAELEPGGLPFEILIP
jgi:hypothetical protein